MQANLFKCRLLIDMQENMVKKIFKIEIPGEIPGDLIVNF